MAVEAHHLHLFHNSQILRTRDMMSSAENQASPYNDMQMGFLAAPAAGSTASIMPTYVNPSAPTAAASESGLTFSNLPTTTLSRKRPRNDSDGGGLRQPPLSFLGEEVSYHVQQQLLEIDQLILLHAERVRMELMERGRHLTRQIAAAAEAASAKRLKAKEEEIEKIGQLNWALEERIKSLCVENQIWRDVAQSNEAAANVLRSNLEQLLAAQAKVKEEPDCAAVDAADDAESCCCGDNSEDHDKVETAVAQGTWPPRRVCRSCREREPSVLLLPCRHLCLCAACSPAANACPVCNCGKKGSVHVKMA